MQCELEVKVLVRNNQTERRLNHLSDPDETTMVKVQPNPFSPSHQFHAPIVKEIIMLSSALSSENYRWTNG